MKKQQLDKQYLLKKKEFLNLAELSSIISFCAGFAFLVLTGSICSSLPQEIVNLKIATPIAAAELFLMPLSISTLAISNRALKSTQKRLDSMYPDSTIGIETNENDYQQLN